MCQEAPHIRPCLPAFPYTPHSAPTCRYLPPTPLCLPLRLPFTTPPPLFPPSVETLNSLVEAYKQHWSDEVLSHNQREQTWLHIQEEWETLEKKMEKELLE